MRKTFKATDIILILILVFAAVCFFIFSDTEGKGTQAVVTAGGEVYSTYDLDKITEPVTIEVNGCKIEITKDGARFINSTCRDKICVKSGMISKPSAAASCIPNKVTISIKVEKSSVDAVAY